MKRIHEWYTFKRNTKRLQYAASLKCLEIVWETLMIKAEPWGTGDKGLGTWGASTRTRPRELWRYWGGGRPRVATTGKRGRKIATSWKNRWGDHKGNQEEVVVPPMGRTDGLPIRRRDSWSGHQGRESHRWPQEESWDGHHFTGREGMWRILLRTTWLWWSIA